VPYLIALSVAAWQVGEEMGFPEFNRGFFKATWRREGIAMHHSPAKTVIIASGCSSRLCTAGLAITNW
jgi:hypothetical protein